MKKKFKALAAFALAGAMALALTACGGSGDAAKSEGDGAASGRRRTSASSPAASRAPTYAYGNVLAQYASNGDYGVKVTALSGNGSQANVQALQDDDADIAFCQSDVLAYAYDGTNIFEEGRRVQGLSIVADLYQEQVQIVTCDPSIKTVADLCRQKRLRRRRRDRVYFNAVDVLKAYDDPRRHQPGVSVLR